MADFLEEKKREIDKRLKELRPLVDEFHRLEAAARRTRRARKATSARSAPRGRPRGSGARSKQALELVRSRPGITIPEMAQAIGIQQNYLYRVLPALQKDGLVRKEGRGWHPREAA